MIETFRKTKSPLEKRRKSKLTERYNRIILQEIKQYPKLTVPKLADSLPRYPNIKVNPQTVRNINQENGCQGCVARKKRFISTKSMKNEVGIC